jgi:hypothetical protein
MSYYYPYNKSKAYRAYPPAESSPVKNKIRQFVMEWSNSSLLLRKEKNIPVTIGNYDN